MFERKTVRSAGICHIPQRRKSLTSHKGAPMSLPREFWTDARHYQIAALSTLLAFNLGWLDFGARPLNSALAIISALVTQALCTRLFGLPTFDPRSPLITGLSLSLLLR